jgi:acyl-CoA thioester hydrolase
VTKKHLASSHDDWTPLKSYTHDYTVHLDDLDYQNHVNHAKWLTLFERARVESMKQAGFSIKWFTENELGLVIANVSINYFAPAFYGDLVSIETHSISSSVSSIKVKNIAKCKEKILVEATVTSVCVNSKGRPVKIPAEVLEKFA